MTIDIAQSILVVIDMQNGFLVQRTEHVLPPVLTLIQEFGKLKRPVVFTRFHNAENSPYERLIGWKRLRSSPETDLTSAVQPYVTNVIDKNIYSAFTAEFIRLLTLNGWTTLVICGVATDSCVLKTAVDAFERDLTPIVVSDACASHGGEEAHNAGLLVLGRFIGKKQIVDTASVLSALRVSHNTTTGQVAR
jgi:nicotinamidase-related amidase